MTAAAAANPPAPTVRATTIELVSPDGERLARANIVIYGDDFPEIVMWLGDPYLRDEKFRGYRKVRPYRLDAGA